MTENILMTIIATAVAVFVVGLGIYKFFQLHNIKVPINTKYPLKDILSFLVKNNEAKRRILVTITILVIIRLCYLIPSPGINADVLRQFFNNIARTSGGGIFTFYLGTAFSRLSIVGLGIMPFLVSCVLIQVFSVFKRSIRQDMFGGEKGRRKVVKRTYILTIILALIQSFFLSLWLENPARFQGLQVALFPGMQFRIITMLSMTAAVIILLLLAGIINRYGIGNGVPMIVLAGIVMGYISGGFQIYKIFNLGAIQLYKLIMLLTILAGLAWLAFIYTNNNKSVLLKNNKTDKDVSVPVRSSWIGEAPISLAKGIYSIPVFITANIASIRAMHVMMRHMNNMWTHFIVVGTLTFGCAFLFLYVIYSPRRLNAMLQRYDFTFKETETSKKISLILDENVAKTAALLILMAFTPIIIAYLFKLPSLAASIFGGLEILIVIGIISDILGQAEFLYEKNMTKGTKLEVAYVAFDEIEAEVKKEYLKTQGIESIVEPLRFTWGLPIRTAVDQYRIYTQADKISDARGLLKE